MMVAENGEGGEARKKKVGGSRCLTEVRGGSWRLVRVPGG